MNAPGTNEHASALADFQAPLISSLFKAVIKNTSDALLFVANKEQVIYANPKALETFDCTSARIQGKTLNDVFWPEGDEPLSETLFKENNEKTNFWQPLTSKLNEDEPIEFECLVKPFEADTGSLSLLFLKKKH